MDRPLQTPLSRIEDERDQRSTAQRVMAALRLQGRIVGAILMRDMRTRFGRSYLSYVIAILWPLSHLLVLLGVYTLTTKLAPIGSNTTVFVASGILPYILCIYPSRQMMLAVAVNQPLLLFPIVKTTDLMIARAILEILTSSIVVFCFGLILYMLDIDFMPLDVFEALMAICASVGLGMGFGFANVIGWGLFKQGWNIASIILMIIMYSTSGVMWLPSSLSESVREVSGSILAALRPNGFGRPISTATGRTC